MLRSDGLGHQDIAVSVSICGAYGERGDRSFVVHWVRGDISFEAHRVRVTGPLWCTEEHVTRIR